MPSTCNADAVWIGNIVVGVVVIITVQVVTQVKGWQSKAMKDVFSFDKLNPNQSHGSFTSSITMEENPLLAKKTTQQHASVDSTVTTEIGLCCVSIRENPRGTWLNACIHMAWLRSRLVFRCPLGEGASSSNS